MQPDPEDAIPAVVIVIIIIDLEQSYQTDIHQGPTGTVEIIAMPRE